MFRVMSSDLMSNERPATPCSPVLRPMDRAFHAEEDEDVDLGQWTGEASLMSLIKPEYSDSEHRYTLMSWLKRPQAYANRVCAHERRNEKENEKKNKNKNKTKKMRKCGRSTTHTHCRHMMTPRSITLSSSSDNGCSTDTVSQGTLEDQVAQYV